MPRGVDKSYTFEGLIEILFKSALYIIGII